MWLLLEGIRDVLFRLYFPIRILLILCIPPSSPCRPLLIQLDRFLLPGLYKAEHGAVLPKQGLTAARLPDELLLDIFQLAADSIDDKHEYARFGLAVMLLSRKWRIVGFRIRFSYGGIPAFTTRDDLPAYNALRVQVNLDHALAAAVARICTSESFRRIAWYWVFLPHWPRHITYEGNYAGQLWPPPASFTSLTLRDLHTTAPYFLRLFKFPFYYRDVTALALINVDFHPTNPASRLSTRSLPSLATLVTSRLGASYPSELQAALRGILPQLSSLTVLDWGHYPTDALACCASLTHLTARVSCEFRAAVASNWPRNLPVTLKSLTLVGACTPSCRLSVCWAFVLLCEVVDELTRSSAVLPDLRELILAGPFPARIIDDKCAALVASRGIRIERRVSHTVERIVELVSQGHFTPRAGY